MGGPVRNLAANIQERRQERQERRAERRGYGNCHASQSQFEGCRTQVEVCQPDNFRRSIASGVARHPVPNQQRSSVAPAAICENSYCTPAGGAPSTTAPSTTTTTPSAATKNYLDTKGQYGVKLEEGVYARIEGGKILATIDVSSNPSRGKFDYFYKEGNLSSRGSFDLNIVRAGSSGVVFDKTAANKLNARAESTVDEIKLKIPDGKGGSREISISKESILKAEAAAEKQAADAKKQAEVKAKPQASTPQATPEPRKEAVPPAQTAEVPKEQPKEEAKKTEAETSPATETVKPPETAPAAETPSASTGTEYEDKLSVQAGEVEKALQSKTGWDLYNYPALDTWQSNLRGALAQFPTVTERAALVEKVTPEKLGLLIHESTAFQAPGGAMDMILAPLGDKAYVLKSAVDTVHKEFAKIVSSYDKPAISDALGKLDRIEKEEPGASQLAAVYYSQIANDDRYTTPYKFDEAVRTLRDAVASPTAETPSASTGTDYGDKLSVQAKEVENALQSKTGWDFYNYPALDTWQSNLRGALKQFPTVGDRAALVEKVGPEKLGSLIYGSEAFKAPGGSMDMILEPLGYGADALKSAVDTIAYEFSRSLTGYDKPAIKAALSKLDSLEKDSPGAMKLAAVHFSSKTGYDTPGKFDEAVKTLRDAVAE